LTGGISDIDVQIEVIGLGLSFSDIMKAANERSLQSIVKLLVSAATIRIFYEA
jgi:hypothetical protein